MERTEGIHLCVSHTKNDCNDAGHLKKNNNNNEHHIKILNSDNNNVIETVKGSDKKKRKNAFVCFNLPTINKYLILVLYSVYSLISGPTYFNWNPLRDILFSNGTYSWLCDKSVTDESDRAYVDPETNQCNFQKININRLYTICVSAHFAFSMLGGILLDVVGPKISSIVGLTSQAIGWTLLGSSYVGFKAYILAMIFIGFGIDCSFFPLLSAVNLFSKFKSTVIAIWGASRSLSFAVPFVLKEITRASGFTILFSHLCYGYVGVGLGFCYFTSFLCVPCQPFVDEELGTKGATEAAEVAGAAEAADFKAKKKTQFDKTQATNDIHVSKQVSIKNDPSTTNTNVADNYQICTHNNMISNNQTSELIIADCHLNEQNAKTTNNSSFFKNFIQNLKDFAPYFFSSAYLPLIPFIVFTLIRCVFFQCASQDLLKSCLSAFEIVAILSFLPCPLLGWISDKMGIVFVMHICNLLATLMLICVIIPNSAVLQYISIFLYSIIVSFLMSQFYCYVASIFPKEHLGKMIGILTTIGGLFSLLADPMYQYSLQSSFYLMLGLLIGCSIINMFLLEIIRRTKNKVIAKVKSDDSLKM